MNTPTENIDIKYLIANEADQLWGMTVSNVGFQMIPAGSDYPPKNHPSGYYFSFEKGRILPEYQLLYITNGQGVFSSSEVADIPIQSGSLFLLFPGHWHTYRPETKTGWKEYYIGFSGKMADQLADSEFISPQTPVLNVGINEEIVRLFRSAIDTAKADKIGAQQLLSGIVMHILGIALSITKNKLFEDDRLDQKIERAKIIMREKLLEDIDLEQLASQLNLSYSWFRKIFKEYTGFSPAKYFQELKIQKAKELLTYTNKPIKEISIILHYESAEHFSTLFKKINHLTPLEYRHFGQQNLPEEGA